MIGECAELNRSARDRVGDATRRLVGAHRGRALDGRAVGRRAEEALRLGMARDGDRTDRRRPALGCTDLDRKREAPGGCGGLRGPVELGRGTDLGARRPRHHRAVGGHRLPLSGRGAAAARCHHATREEIADHRCASKAWLCRSDQVLPNPAHVLCPSSASPSIRTMAVRRSARDRRSEIPSGIPVVPGRPARPASLHPGQCPVAGGCAQQPLDALASVLWRCEPARLQSGGKRPLMDATRLLNGDGRLKSIPFLC